MADVYRCLDEGGVGVFESPTGTGKSLSLICSTMRWLLDQEQKDADAVTSPAPSLSSGGDPSWVEEQTAASVQQQRSQAHTELIERRRLRAARVAAYDAADRATGGAGSVGEGARGWATHAGKRGLVAKAGTGARGGPEGEFLVEWSGASDDPAEALLDPSLLLDRPDDDEVEAPRRPQVFYTSRTHSQLAQVVGEVKKTGYKGKVAVVALGSRKNLCINEELRGLEGARLNEACLDLQDKASKERKAAATDGGSSDAEQSSKTDSNDSTTVTKSKRRNEGGRHQKKRGGCPHLAGGEARQARVLDRLLVSPLEIEELAGLGRRENACPYYAARAALPEAQLVALPYASLLSSSTRQALGLRLAGSVVVIDEAHNLIDTINEMHSVTLSARHLSETSAQLAQYEERYRARLKPANRQMVQQLLFVVRALRRALLPHVPAVAGSVAGIQAQVRPPGAGPASAAAGAPAAGATIPGTADERIVAVNSLLCSLNVDHINLLRLKAFCEASELAKKLQGFSEAQVQVQTASHTSQPGHAQRSDGVARCTLHPVIALLEALAHADGDARVLLHIDAPAQPQPKVAASGGRGGSWLRVLHLNPATYFASVLSEARAIVLCGGTMQPFDDFHQQLFRALPPGRVRTSAYDHIVPPKSLLPVVFGHGPGGGPLTFSFGTRAAPALMDELGKLLLHVAGAVPDGLVIFVPSFQYEAQLVARWESTGMWAQLDAVKKTFREPRAASDVEAVLAAYSDAIDRARTGLPGAQQQPEAAGGAQPGGSTGRSGALLISVVGGKMSEW